MIKKLKALFTTWIGRFVLFGVMAVVGGALIENVDEENKLFFIIYITGASLAVLQGLIMIGVAIINFFRDMFE